MPALTVPSAPSTTENGLKSEVQAPSPTAPPYSPITPTMSASLPANSTVAADNANFHAHPAFAQSHNAAVVAQNARTISEGSASQQSAGNLRPPAPEPIHMSDNPDAIALRAATSILQLQRQQALRDLKLLEVQKEKALEDPEGFARGVSEGKIKARGMSGILPLSSDHDGTEARDDGRGDRPDTDKEFDGNKDQHTNKNDTFGTIPSAQNVVRMPPVNWAKYHVVGESLDKLHEEQRVRPSLGQATRDENQRPGERAQESVIAAPYNPWIDKVDEKPTRTKKKA